MSMIEQSIEVEVPVRDAYDQWTQFEEFPSFMDGVESVRQVDDIHLHWVAEIGGQRREFDAVVTEQTPDQRIAWTTQTGPTHAGVVTFHHLAEGRSKVMLQLEYEPEGLVENIGDWLGMVERTAIDDLARFKKFVENRPGRPEGWRGTVERPH
jgi:uncharacterized membrane protein